MLQEILTTSVICFTLTLVGLSLGFVLLKVTQGE
jgi:PetM family of cytochrome b6f complex subunit 7